jgi:hypothetical protein
MTELALRGSELTEWLALRRVALGGISLSACIRYLDGGRPLLFGLEDQFDRFLVVGFIRLAPGDEYGVQRVVFSPAGLERFSELEARRQSTPSPLAAAFGSPVRPAGAASMRGRPGRPPQWEYSPLDGRIHVVDADADADEVALCGIVLHDTTIEIPAAWPTTELVMCEDCRSAVERWLAKTAGEVPP